MNLLGAITRWGMAIISAMSLGQFLLLIQVNTVSAQQAAGTSLARGISCGALAGFWFWQVSKAKKKSGDFGALSTTPQIPQMKPLIPTVLAQKSLKAESQARREAEATAQRTNLVLSYVVLVAVFIIVLFFVVIATHS